MLDREREREHRWEYQHSSRKLFFFRYHWREEWLSANVFAALFSFFQYSIPNNSKFLSLFSLVVYITVNTPMFSFLSILLFSISNSHCFLFHLYRLDFWTGAHNNSMRNLLSFNKTAMGIANKHSGVIGTHTHIRVLVMWLTLYNTCNKRQLWN